MKETAWEREIAQRDAIICRQADEIAALKQELAEVKSRLKEKAATKDAKRPTFSQDYSLSRQQREKSRRRRKKSTGRKPREAKQQRVERIDDIYPPGVPPRRCELAREQCAWRLEEGRAVYVRYRIFRERGSQEVPPVFGLRNSRCEFGLEFHVVWAFLIYSVGMSIDQARAVVAFFTRMELSKSQADSLLNQLAADWEEDFNALCQLVAMAAVLYIDETGWKVGKRACYTWIFTTLSHVVFLCGKGRGGNVLDGILPKGFPGIGVTDFDHRQRVGLVEARSSEVYADIGTGRSKPLVRGGDFTVSLGTARAARRSASGIGTFVTPRRWLLVWLSMGTDGSPD
jgi:hypothetical protein